MTTTIPMSWPAVQPPTLDSFERLVSEHQRAVCAVAFSALGDRAVSEEIAQEAFLVAWRKLPTLNEPPKLPSWICGIARNLARNARRSLRRSEASDELDARESGAASPLDELVSAEDAALVERALASLDEAQREPLVLFYRQELSMKEVARALDISEATAKQRVSRARERLAERVMSTVERSLRASGPGAAFTAAAVAAAVALPPTVASAAPVKAAAESGLQAWLSSKTIVALGLGTAAALGLGWLALRSGPHDQAPAALASAQQPGALVPSQPLATSTAPADRSAASLASARRFPASSRHRSSAASLPSDQPAPSADAETRLDRALQRKVDLTLNQAKTGEVLGLLGQLLETPIVVRGEIGESVSVDLKSTSGYYALDHVLESAGAVWEEVEVVRVVGSPGPAGPVLHGRQITATLNAASFEQVLTHLGEALEKPVLLDKALQPAPVSLEAKELDAGTLLSELVKGAGLRYEVVPGIEVVAEEDDD
jgi:RNA polymerase sigma factor (sigma-70 family)